MVSLSQKLKMPKLSETPFYKNITVVLFKKQLKKTPNARENEIFLKSSHLAKAIAHAKAISCLKFSVWVKN